MPCGDGGAVMLVVKGGGPEVNQSDVGLLHHAHQGRRGGRLGRLGGGGLRGRDARGRLHVVVIQKEHILRLQVRVGEMIFVEVFDRVGQLVGDVAHLVHRIGVVAVFLEKVVDALAQHVEQDANVAVIVEVVNHFDAEERAGGVLVAQLVEHVDFQLRGVPVLFHVADDLQRQGGSARTLHVGHTNDPAGKEGGNTRVRLCGIDINHEIRKKNVVRYKGQLRQSNFSGE